MRGILLPFSVYIPGLLPLVCAQLDLSVTLQLSPLGILGGTEAVNLPDSTSSSTAPGSITATASTSFESSTVLSTTTLALSYPTRSSSTNSSRLSATTSTFNIASTTDSGIPSIRTVSLGSSSSSEATSASASQPMSNQRRTLIIVLSTVLGSVTLVLIAVALCLTCRYRKGKAPFRHRGVTPINDDEIESWRGTVLEQKKQPHISETGSANTPKSAHTPRGASIDSIALKHSPAWTWNASPSTAHSNKAPIVPETPPFVARAPNSRVGLTDEAVPGADPFIPPVKRQSSRLSKAPPGHGRTKSRRSSISTKSIRSYNGGTYGDSKGKDEMPSWYNRDDESVGTGLKDTEPTDSPGTSIWDGLSAGGLSPRPKSKSQLRPWQTDNKDDIGRAIA